MDKDYAALFWINFIFLHGNSIVYYQVISSLYSTGFEPAAISWSSDSCNVDRDVLVNRIPKAVIFVHNKQNFSINWYCGYKKMWNASRFCVSSLRRGHANLLCIVPILVYAHPKVDKKSTSYPSIYRFGNTMALTYWNKSIVNIVDIW